MTRMPIVDLTRDPAGAAAETLARVHLRLAAKRASALRVVGDLLIARLEEIHAELAASPEATLEDFHEDVFGVGLALGTVHQALAVCEPLGVDGEPL